MTKKDLIKIIREVVKREMKDVVKSEINEALTILEHKKSVEPKKQYAKSTMLNEVLNETEGWPEISQRDVQNRFGAQGSVPTTDINNRPVNTSKLDPALNKALTRDYTDLVKRFKK